MPPKPGLCGNTLRQVFQTAMGGTQVRLWFSNEFGQEPLVIAHAHVALSEGGSQVSADGCAVTFEGHRQIAIAPGERIASDPVKLAITPLSKLALTLHFGAVPQAITGHPGSRTTSFIHAGNVVSQSAIEDAVRVEHWYFVCRIDAWTRVRTSAIVTLGDSITDGRGSTTDGNDRWPNHLARRLLERDPSSSVAVLNQGIGGNRVLSDGLGPSALSRFERDVLTIPNVRWLIVFEGINDIGTAEPSSDSVARELIAAYSRMITLSHARGIRVYGATLMPFEGSFYFTEQREAHRKAVNAFIRSGAFDGVIDFEVVARDPKNAARLCPDVDSGDCLHPSANGHRRLGESVVLAPFET